MDQRLMDAAREGDIDAMYVLLREDPYILDNIDRVPFIDTPLHIAVSARKNSFAIEIANLKPSLAKKLNLDGYSPMHLASAIGDIGMVKEFMTIGREICLLKGRDKRTSLHHAAMSGSLDVINELVHEFPKSIIELTVQKETALHLALKNNQMIEELLRTYDDPCPQIDRALLWVPSMLFEINIPKVEVNAKNAINQTALDILFQLPTEARNYEIGDILRCAKAVRGFEISSTSPPLTKNALSKIPRPSRGLMRLFGFEMPRDCPMEVRNALLVVAVLTATATFQAGVNPPGGVWQDNFKPEKICGNNTFVAASPSEMPHTAGEAIMATNIGKLRMFTFSNLLGFLMSYQMITFLLLEIPFRGFIHLALFFMTSNYLASLSSIYPLEKVFDVVDFSLVAYLLFGVLLMVGVARPMYRQMKQELEQQQMGREQEKLQMRKLLAASLNATDMVLTHLWAGTVRTASQPSITNIFLFKDTFKKRFKETFMKALQTYSCPENDRCEPCFKLCFGRMAPPDVIDVTSRPVHAA
ncbi:hypothetical protein HHK36_000886 [Tetracentron sinense]|uniref:PGG domain-containing protein n=1 Tax=Tetracentron sinense TaxID=13715 RepID=A0A834ZSB5_TETSI|nr:hypothetical protein HHK36_000886 [Tetracentron sinense]